MRLDNALDDVFSSSSHVKVLRALFAIPPGLERSGRDIARRADVSHPRANQVLSDLVEQGLVNMKRQPRTDLYQLNRQHVLVQPLGELLQLESRLKTELLSLIARELKARKLPVTHARVFGSAIHGTMRSGSDVDLALVTSSASVGRVEAAAQDLAETVRERFGTRLNVLVGAPSLAALTRSHSGAVWRAVDRDGLDVFAGTGAHS